jgi:hypothetical protein
LTGGAACDSLDWRCPVSLALCAGAYLVASRSLSVRRLTGPFVVIASPACTNRRISVLAEGDYSSRSQPIYSLVAGSLRADRCSVKEVGRIDAVVNVVPREHYEGGDIVVMPRRLTADEKGLRSAIR